MSGDKEIGMIKYIKSELYRVVHSKGVYLLAGICLSMMLAVNLILAYFRGKEPSFAYGNTAFAFGMLGGFMQPIFFLTLLMGCLIFADEYKNKTIMNSIAFGFSRLTVYFGKLAVALIVSVTLLALLLGIFIGSGMLLLENSGTEVLCNLLKGFGACIPIFITGEVAAITFAFLIGSVMGSTWTWMGVFVCVPMACELLGMKFEIFTRISKWLAYSVAGEGTMTEDMGFVMVWMSREGFIRCILTGLIGTAVFLVIGVLGMRRKELI